MVKIRAKQILNGKTAATFFSLLLPRLLSLVSLVLTGGVLYLSSLESTLEFAEGYLGEYAYIGVISASVILCCAFLFIFALGKKLYYYHSVRRTGTVFATDCRGALKTMQFLIFTVVRFLFVLAWLGLFMLPASIGAAIGYYFISTGEMTVGMLNVFMSGEAVLASVGLFFLFVTVQRYSLWGYALCKKGSGVFSSLETSLKRTDGQMIKIAFFKISILPWLLLCALIIPSVYAIPYYETAVALRLLYRGRRKKYEASQSDGFAAVFTVKKRATE